MTLKTLQSGSQGCISSYTGKNYLQQMILIGRRLAILSP
jgi:hypothetical protein